MNIHYSTARQSLPNARCYGTIHDASTNLNSQPDQSSRKISLMLTDNQVLQLCALVQHELQNKVLHSAEQRSPYCKIIAEVLE
jgi:hypothetical protein